MKIIMILFLMFLLSSCEQITKQDIAALCSSNHGIPEYVNGNVTCRMPNDIPSKPHVDQSHTY